MREIFVYPVVHPDDCGDLCVRPSGADGLVVAKERGQLCGTIMKGKLRAGTHLLGFLFILFVESRAVKLCADDGRILIVVAPRT